MAGRTSSRSATREQASSPPKPPQQSQSPPRRITRATRSQSRDISENEAPPKRTRRARNARSGSVESVSSVESGDGRRSGRRKNTHAANRVEQELTMVPEDREMEEDENAPAEDEDEEFEKGLRSPGAMSNLSGTTAITSHSQLEMASLDREDMIDILPELYSSTNNLLNYLIPEDLSIEAVDQFLKELQIPGTRKGKRLLYLETAFENCRNNRYGTDTFINLSFVTRKLFNDQDLGPGDFRPDPIFYAANIATLVKTLLVTLQNSTSTMNLLRLIDGRFPTPFVSSFENEPELKSRPSELLEETFELALYIRTQATIATLKAYKEEPDFDPDQLLVQLFYNPPDQDIDSLPAYKDWVIGGHIRPIAGLDFEDTLAAGIDADTRVKERLDLIRESFRDRKDITGQDYVDFESLDEEFPWIEFLAMMLRWSRSRMLELQKSILSQGNADGLVEALIRKTEDTNNQASRQDGQPAAIVPKEKIVTAKALLPAADIKRIRGGDTGLVSPSSVKLLAERKRALKANASAPPSNQQQLRPQSPRVTEIAGPYGDDKDEPRDNRPRIPSTQQMAERYELMELDKNKENRPVVELSKQTGARSFIDRQDNAERITFDSQGEEERPSIRQGKKRSHELTVESQEEDDEEGLSEDEGFQQDNRPIPVRIQPQLSTRQRGVSPVQEVSLPKRQRISGPYLDSSDSQLARRQGDNELQASAAQYDDDNVPQMSYSIIQQASTQISSCQRATQGPGRTIQRRVRWGEDETQWLIEMIGKWGCRWSQIHNVGMAEERLEGHRDQGALKDKARNIKVDYLISGHKLLKNFDQIHLSKKELDKVRAAGQNPYRREGERRGEEELDEYGNER